MAPGERGAPSSPAGVADYEYDMRFLADAVDDDFTPVGGHVEVADGISRAEGGQRTLLRALEIEGRTPCGSWVFS